MRIRTKLTGILLLALCAVFIASTVAAADPPLPVREADVNLQRIKSIFDAAFIKAEFDGDGDLMIEDGGLRAFVKVEEDTKLICYFAMWGLKASVPEIKKLRLVNTMNDKVIFVRFCMPDQTTLWCDYQLLYTGGITPFAVVSNYRLFAQAIRQAVVTRDPEDIIGSD